MFRLVLAAFLLVGATSEAKFQKYAELQVKDLDDMMKIVNESIRKSKQLAIQAQKDNPDDDSEDLDAEAVAELKEAVKLVLSRPNKDNLLSNLMMPLRRELQQYEAYEAVMTQVVDIGIKGVTDTSLNAAQKATMHFVLTNAISEMKPEIGQKPAFRQAVERIRDSKLEISPDVKRDLKMTSMYELKSPSEVAKNVLALPIKPQPQVKALAKPEPSPEASPEPEPSEGASQGKKKRKIEVR